MAEACASCYAEMRECEDVIHNVMGAFLQESRPAFSQVCCSPAQLARLDH